MQRAVISYNRAVGSLESRVLVTARKLGERSGVDRALPEVAPLDATLRGVVNDLP